MRHHLNFIRYSDKRFTRPPPAVSRNQVNIEDVKRLLIVLIASVLGIAVPMFGWWGCRELSIRNTESKYSREFKPGMKRQAIEDRLLAGGVRFWPDSSFNADFVSAGNEVSYALICAPREAGLLLEFEGDVLQSVKPVRQERGCV